MITKTRTKLNNNTFIFLQRRTMLSNLLKKSLFQLNTNIILQHTLRSTHLFSLAPGKIYYITKTGYTAQDLLHIPDEHLRQPLLLAPPQYSSKKASGFMSLSFQERSLLTIKNDSENALNFRKDLLIILCKVLFNTLYITHEKLSQDNDKNEHEIMAQFLKKGLKDVLGNFNTENLSLDSPILVKKLITILQHNLTFLFYPKKFHAEVFKNFCGSAIDTTSHNDDNAITIISFVEALVVQKALLEPYFAKNLLTQIVKVNNDLIGATPFYNTQESLQQTGQLHADFIIRHLNLFKKESTQSYIDVKSHGDAIVNKRQVSLFYGTDKNYINQINNLRTTLKSYIKHNCFDINNAAHASIFKMLNRIDTIHLSKKTLPEKWTQILQITYSAMLDKNLKTLFLGLKVDAGIDDSFNEVIQQILEKIRDKDLNFLFPQNGIIDTEQQEAFVRMAIKEFFPEEMQQTMNANFETFILKKKTIEN